MIQEFERIYLSDNLDGTPYIKGDVGTVVFVYPEAKAYEVEFFALDGSTLSVETVPAAKIKSAKGVKKVLHINETQDAA